MLAGAPSFQLSAETDWLSHLQSSLQARVLQDISAKSSQTPSGNQGRVASYKPSKELKTEKKKVFKIGGSDNLNSENYALITASNRNKQ